MAKSELDDLFFAADKKAKQKIFDVLCKEYWEYKVEELGVRGAATVIGGGTLPEIVEERLNYVDLVQGRKQWGALSSTDTYAVFVTVSPPPGSITPVDLLSMAQKCFKLCTSVISWHWCVEQGGSYVNEEPPLGYHPHVHALASLAWKSQNERTEVAKRVKYHFGKIPTKNINVMIQCKAVSKSGYAKKLAYIEGKKTDPAKQLQVESDVIWREHMGLLHVYSTDPKYKSPVWDSSKFNVVEKESEHYLGSDSSSVSEETD